MPIATGWISEYHLSIWPTFLYGAVLFMAAVSYHLLQSVIIVSQGENSALKKFVGKDYKGKLSILVYAIASILAFFSPVISQIIYLLIALIWLIPDRRIENSLEGEKGRDNQRKNNKSSI